MITLSDDTFTLVCEFLTPKEIGNLNCSSKKVKNRIDSLPLIWFLVYKRYAEFDKEGYGNEHICQRDCTCYLTYSHSERAEILLYHFNDIKFFIPTLPYIFQDKNDKRKFKDFYIDFLKKHGVKEQVDQLAQTYKCCNILHKNRITVYNPKTDYVKLYKKLLKYRFGATKFYKSDEKLLQKLEERIKNWKGDWKGKREKLADTIRKRDELLKTKRMVEMKI